MCKLGTITDAGRSAKVRKSYVMGTQSVVSAVSQSAANQSTSTCVCSASSAVSAKKQLEEALKINEPLAKGEDNTRLGTVGQSGCESLAV